MTESVENAFRTAADHAPTLDSNQQLIWLGQRQAPDLPIYEISYQFDIDGPVDPERFSRAFEAWVDSTPIMRWVAADEQWTAPNLVSHCPRPNDIRELDSAGCADQEIEEAIADRMAQRLNHTSALYDSLLIHVGREKSVWLMRVHHSLTDASNGAVMLAQLSAFYEAIEPDRERPEFPEFQNLLDLEERHPRDKTRDDGQWWQERTGPPAQNNLIGYGKGQDDR